MSNPNVNLPPELAERIKARAADRSVGSGAGNRPMPPFMLGGPQQQGAFVAAAQKVRGLLAEGKYKEADEVLAAVGVKTPLEAAQAAVTAAQARLDAAKAELESLQSPK